MHRKYPSAKMANLLGARRLRVFNTLVGWTWEYPLYRRDEKGRPNDDEKNRGGVPSVPFRYRVVEGAAGAAGVVAGEAGAAGVVGRVVDEPTVVRGAVLSATFGPLHGAHIKIATISAIAAMAPRIMPPIPVSVRPAARRLGSVLVLRFWSSLSISIPPQSPEEQYVGTQRLPPRSA